MGKQEGGDDNDIDQQLVRALGHPLRREILRVLSEGPSSPKKMSDLLGEPLGNVSYHTNVLAETDCIELIETRPARGAVEHIYRAKPHGTLGARSWQKVPQSLRKDMAGAALDAFTTCAIRALETEAFEEHEGAGLSWFPLTLDKAGWEEVRRLIANAEKRIRDAAGKSAARLTNPEDGISVVVAFAAFETGGREDRPGR
jgi:DNA-binding transcriptional ArsR family regulator